MIRSVKQVGAALRSRSLAFTVLIAQIAVGMLVVSHALVLVEVFLRQQGLTGADMDGSFCITSEDDDAQLPPRDLAALERLPGVRHAAWVANTPIHQRRLADTLLGSRRGMGWGVYGTSDAAAAYGFELVKGRALTTADEAAGAPRPVLVTAALATALFGAEEPVERTITSRDTGAAYRVVGILREAGIVPPVIETAQNVLVEAGRPVQARRAEYIVNVDAAHRAGFPAAAEAALRAGASHRFLRVETLRDLQVRIFEARTGAIIVFGSIGALFLGVILLGSTGMSAFLVAERLREIGIRRALGARRRDIAACFLFENFAVTSLGVVLGAALSAFANVRVVRHAMSQAVLDFRHLFLAMILFWVTGLLAATMPALRASRVPPSVASKTV